MSKKTRKLVIAAFLSVFITTSGMCAQKAEKNPPQEAAAKGLNVPPEFQVGAGDTLRVDVWKEPEVSAPQVVIRPDCRITLPLIKDLEVCGLTPLQIQKEITDKLGKFVASPDVTVIVLAIHSQKVYIVGNVRRAGPIPLVGPMTVADALGEIGGPSEYSSMKNVVVQRQEGSKTVRYKFNYKDFLKGSAQEQNIALKSGDTIIVK